MEDPIKIIYKYKNLNKRIQYELFIFIGFLIKPKIKQIIEKFKDLNFYDCLMEISKKEYNILEDKYGKNWIKFFFINQHIDSNINLIKKSPQKKKDLIDKYGKEWYKNNIDQYRHKDKMMYSYQSLYKKERELRERSKKFREKSINYEVMDYTNKGQKGGDGEEVNKITIDQEGNNPILDDNDEFDLDELENMFQVTEEVDTKLDQTSKLIDNIMKKDEKNITKKDNLVDFPKDKINLMYDDSFKNVYKKNYIYNQYIYKDDSIKKIKQKICCSIKLNSIFESSGNTKHKSYIIPSRQYLWSNYNFVDQIDNKLKSESVMLGQKWIKRNELLKIEVEPNNNIRIYEQLKNNLKFLKQDMRKYGSRIRREEDENKLLEDYDEYINNNEIYMLDIYNELGLNYTTTQENIKNIYDILIKIYFIKINFEDLNSIINYVNIRGNEEKRNREIKLMNDIYKTLNNDLIIENEIIRTVEETNIENNKIFKNNFITHCVIHVYINHKNNFGNNFIDLFRIFDNFTVNREYPFVHYQLPDGKMVYKFFTKLNVNNKNSIKGKWFESSPYGISFKIKIGKEEDKYISITLFETGRIEYKVQWKEEDMATVEDIKQTYSYVKNLIDKINSENTKIKIMQPTDIDFNYAFINSIQAFEFSEKKSINHNDLSDFCRYFYPYISLVIEPRKRLSKIGKVNTSSKFGTYLRYKRVSKYENELKIEHRIIYFMRNYEYTDASLVKEISKQFNITEKVALKKIEDVKVKYPVIKRSRKVLKKIENAPKYNPPGIGVDIQGKSRLNYKIRIAGARNKKQLTRIIKFINILIYLYVETYLQKKKERIILKEKLKGLNNIAKRRNKVEEIVDVDDIQIKQVKKMTKLDRKRLGFKPREGESHWSRACQNSGKDKNRQPDYTEETQLNKLFEMGYKFNKKSGFYERVIKEGKKEIVLKAVAATDGDGSKSKIYYFCNPEKNGEYKYVGFLSRSKNPNDLCMPCCFKKDPILSKNTVKRNYYLKCIGKETKLESRKKTLSMDKIYILQDTNKIQEGRFGFLPNILDIYLNRMLKHKVVIKNHYLVNTKPSYLFKYGIKTTKNIFLEAMASVFDTTSDILLKKIIEIIENDKDDLLFTSLNSGDLKTQFLTRQNYIDFLKKNDYIEYEIIGDLIGKKNTITKNGLNYYIFEKNSSSFKVGEKNQDDYLIRCDNLDNEILYLDQERNNVILLKDNNVIYPIFFLDKEYNKNAKIKKIMEFNYIIQHCYNFFKIGCNIDNLKKFKKGLHFSAKNINELINKTKKYKIKNQVIDTRNKCKYLILDNNYLIPTYPSGSLSDVKIINGNEKYLQNVLNTLKNLINFTKNVDIEMIPIGIQYTDTKKDKYYIVGLLLEHNISCEVKHEYISQKEIKKLAKLCNRKEFIKVNISMDDKLDKLIKNSEIEIDNRIKFIEENSYKKESYQLFRLELSNYLKLNKNLRENVINIINNSKISEDEKKHLLKKTLMKSINKNLYKKIKQLGGNFVKIDNKIVIDNYTVKNRRDTCDTNFNKTECNSNVHCKWESNNCIFKIDEKNLIYFLNLITNELVKNSLKSKEILGIDNYFVSDIVDYNKFTTRDNQKIIKSNLPNINKILSIIFGKENIPIIGKRKYNKIGKTINEENILNPVEKIDNILIQNIIINNNSIIRTFANCYFWQKNNLYQENIRNLGYYSDLQTHLSNYFKGIMIDFIKSPTNHNILNSILEKHSDKNINLYTTNFLNGKNSFNNLVELCILSYIYKTDFSIFDNYLKLIFYIKDGVVVYNKNIKSSNIDFKKNIYDSTYKNNINIMYEYSESINYPDKIKAIYIL